ncbi:hypothetical protein CDAR_306881 [Caerostris darwini]|uniref:EF-hand domain-containing protein n=1 Tax=Caerostris darwini TaxID=1538125 RepID=A0AAV4QX75_9ARAC|nr:hypothetical protein CDAR_306881 [Caerostris darwini]
MMEFLLDLSVLCRGHISDKLEWLFCLYDINEDGLITKTVLSEIVHSIYCLMSRRHYTESEERNFREHVDHVFTALDLNQDGVITKDEFMEACTSVSENFICIQQYLNL